MYQYTPARASARKKWHTLVSIYGTTCVYCHNNPATHIDHVVPVSWKLSNHISNLRPSCEWCNLHVSDRVFETFEEKYEWLRQERLRKQFGKYKRTVCVVCRLPYQRPLHSPNLFLCAECYDREYDKVVRLRPQWHAWLELCERAGFIIAAHRDLAAWSATLGSTSVSLAVRAEKLAELYAHYEGEWEIEGVTFREEQAEYIAQRIDSAQGDAIIA